TVAPITVHHRVDFAASMIDGRTVGEIDAKSASAREVRDLWIYVQDRLSRLMHDPKLVPEFRPQHFAVAALSSASEPLVEDPPPPTPAPPPLLSEYEGPERRSGVDRRQFQPNTVPLMERRTHPFGRRATDKPVQFGKAAS